MNNFSSSIIDWYNDNSRDLPWRRTTDPYKIWLSEIILQQTRVDQGLPYYLKFIDKFPKIESLAEAHEQDVLKAWQGLGYYSRARNLHFTAKYIVKNYDSVFPSNHAELLSLKGVGDYTASAIASFCFNLPHAVLDGNVSRVLSRYLAIEIPINSTIGRKYLRRIAQDLLDENRASIYNQAIMEFGALQCTPNKPDCNNCPISNTCASFGTELVDILPLKSKSSSIKKRYFNYLIVSTSSGDTFIQKRTSGIWKSLFEFPLIEGNLSLEEIQESIIWQELFRNEKVRINNISNQIEHLLSHQRILATFIHISVDSIDHNYNHLNRVTWEDINTYPIPRLIDKYLSLTINK